MSAESSRVNYLYYVCNYFDIEISASRVIRLVRGYHEREPFPQYLRRRLLLTTVQRRDPIWLRAISYADPTGERAVHNILRRAEQVVTTEEKTEE